MQGQRGSTFNIQNAQLRALGVFVCLIVPSNNYLALLNAVSFDQCNMSK